ncbi:MAG: type 1 glutamine amidotransferase-like domain-containing protein [Planctomycetes bacterium]|nr:type 1 glutamine amidotransferase-like domain-containing protein [Planctomycetota bacterium]
MSERRPIYLFADSQLLFWKQDGIHFLDSIRELILKEKPKAAYIGASNGDQLEFYKLFEAAMENINITDCLMIHSIFSREDKVFLENADLILLAGGDVEQGWDVIASTGMKELITEKYNESALLIGISAGAVQLGTNGRKTEEGIDDLIETLKLVPYIIGTHEEGTDWKQLSKTVEQIGGHVKGIGIPSGGGMIYHSDQLVEPIRHHVYEFSVQNGQVTSSIIMPDPEADEKD